MYKKAETALGRPRGIGWRGRWEGGSGWGIHVNPWLIHVNVRQKPLQYCKVISLQLIKINGKKSRNRLLYTLNLHNFIDHFTLIKNKFKLKKRPAVKGNLKFIQIQILLG